MPRIARKAQNQALFREVNERIAEVSSRFHTTEPQAFICECSRTGCNDVVYLSADAYARVRNDPTTFLVLRGHEDPDHETVVGDQYGYLIVANKPGVAERIAKETA